MANTYNEYTANGSQNTFDYTFPYLKTTDVKVSVDGVLKQLTTDYTRPTVARIQFNSDKIPANGAKVRVYRDTDESSANATFYAGSAIKSQDLNDNFLQAIYIGEEGKEAGDDAWNKLEDSVDSTETWVSNNTTISTTGAIDARVDSKIDTALTTDVVGGDRITVTDNSPGSGQITIKVTPDSIVNSDINSSAAIAGSKVNPAFGSQNISTSGTLASGAATVTGNIAVSGTVDGRDIAADGTKLDGIEASATADQTAAEIRTLVESASDSNVFTDADHSKLNAIEASATADQTASEIRSLVESASDSNVFTDADHSKLNAIEASADVTDATNVNAAGAVMNSDTTTASMQFVVDEDNFSSDSATKVPTQQSTKAYIAATSQPLDSDLTTLAGMPSATASILADSTALTSTTAELNLLDGKSIVTAVSGSSTDVQLPTAKAVNDQIVNLLNEAGGFVPIANEVSFPNANPDPNDGAGTIVSIADAGGVVVNGSGVSTTGRTLGGATVTINGIDSSLYNTTIAAGKGMLVQTTSTLNTYDYHRLTVDEAGVASAQTLVSDFNNRYRIASSAPSSSLDDGDLWFDTANNKMKVYNASGTSWDDVASSGDFYINTLSSSGNTGGGSATFNGSAYRFVLSNPPGTAQQLIVSINGVIQKPNSGTSQPSEGFAISGNDIIFAAAPATSSDYFIITIGNTVSIGTPSDNTVSTAKIQNLAVTGDKIATNLDLADNKKIRFGTGNDLQLYHDGTSSYVVDTTSDLYLQSTNDDIIVKAADDIWCQVQGGENAITMVGSGKVELFYDNSLKFETTSGGAQITGNLVLDGYIDMGAQSIYTDDNGKVRLGTGDDFQIYHDGTTNWIDAVNNHGTVLRAGTGILYLQGSEVHIGDEGGNEVHIKTIDNGAVELYYDDSKKFDTASGGVNVVGYVNVQSGGHVYLEDNGKLMIGGGSDLQIYHNGTNSYFDNNYGHLAIRTNVASDVGGNIYIQPHDNEDGIVVVHDGAVELYHDNVKTFETDSNGIVVKGPEGDYGAIFLYADEGDDDADKWQLKADHVASGFYIQNNTDGTEESIQCFGGGAVKLYYDNSKKLETTSTGAKTDGILELAESATTKGKLQAKAITNVSTTWTDVVTTGIGGLAFITAYNTSGGNQMSALVMWRVGSHTVISEDDNTGCGVDYQTNGAVLQIKTTSGTITGSAICMTV